jgi:serine/threonine-protein kinase
MAEPVDSLDATVQARLETLSPEARTLPRGPRSTVEPSRHDTGDSTRRALDAFEAVSQSLRARSQDVLAIGDVIGEGGMGIVRRATQLVLGREVAVKTLRDGGRDRSRTLDLLREAWTTGALEHPNVVPVYDVGTDEHGGPMVVLKRIEGVAWSDVMHDPEAIHARFGAKDAREWNVRILISVTNALAFAHSRGVVHRDLKPENVMVGRFGEVYLLDWGLAVAMEGGDVRLPRAADANELAGTPAYMAPEMLGGQADRIGPRTDVYLCGAVLFEILRGEPPHDGPTMEALFASVARSEPRLGSSVPAEAARVVRRAMARDPEDRHPSVEALRADLEELLQHDGSRALAARADASRDELMQAIAADAPEDELYDRLGECRFGYRAALASWEGNADARAGLASALEAMAERALATGDPHGAARLVREHPSPSEWLVARVDKAVREREAEQQRLSALERELDPARGARTRVYIVAMMGALWVVVPAAGELRGEPPTYAEMLLFLAIMLALLSGFGAWAKESLGSTLVNRRASATLVFVLCAQALVDLAGWAADVPVRITMTAFPVLWAGILGAVSLWFEPRLWPSTGLALALVAFAMGFPRHISGGIAVFDLVFVANVAWAWLPREDLARAEGEVRRFVDARKRAIDARRRRLLRAVAERRDQPRPSDPR